MKISSSHSKRLLPIFQGAPLTGLSRRGERQPIEVDAIRGVGVKGRMRPAPIAEVEITGQELLLDDIEEGVYFVVPIAERHQNRLSVLLHSRRDARPPDVEAQLGFVPVGGVVEAVELLLQVVCDADFRESCSPGR